MAIHLLVLAVRYYGYTKQISNQSSSIRGRLTRDNNDETDDSEPEKYNYMLSEGTHDILFDGNKLSIKIVRYTEFICDELTHRDGFMHDIEIKLLSVQDDNEKDYSKIIDNFLKKAKSYYEEVVLDHKKLSNSVTVYIYDEWWETLSKKQPRTIDTVHLNGIEQEVLDYIKNFRKTETRERYKRLGIPYKKNILFEGLPGTGKTSLIFALGFLN